MKNTIIKLAGLSILSLAMAGCYSIDDTQKEWTDKGEKIYVGKIDSMYVRSGMNRVEIVGNSKYLRTAVRCTVKYDETTLEYNLSDVIQSDGKVRMMIDGLEGGSYYFDVLTYDADGNTSVPSRVYGVAYGEMDIMSAAPKRVTGLIIKPNGSIDVTWNSAEVTYYTVSWEDEDGKMQEMTIEDSPEITNLKSWKKGGKISVQSFIQNNEDDLDMITLNPLEYAFPEDIEEAIPRFGRGSAMNLGSANTWDLYDEFTMEMRVRYSELAAGDQCVISCEAKPANGMMLRGSGNRLQFYVGDGRWRGITAGDELVIGQWYDLAITYKANVGIELYIDGVFKGSASCGRMQNTTMNLQVGTSPCYRDRYMRGDVQHVSIWKNVRTAEQIKADVEQGYGFSGDEEGLKGYWPMTVNFGNEVEDQTGTRVATYSNVVWNKK